MVNLLKLSDDELLCAMLHADEDLPWRSQYEMAPVPHDEAAHRVTAQPTADSILPTPMSTPRVDTETSSHR
jgi:hypothetical protein